MAYRTPSGLPCGVSDRDVDAQWGEYPDEHFEACPTLVSDVIEDCECHELAEGLV